MNNSSYHKKYFLLSIPVLCLFILASIEYRIFDPSPALQLLSKQKGIASWYCEKDKGINRLTASGEVFEDTLDTCASWYHPLNSYVLVRNLKNKKSVICRVNDRGPNLRLGRIIDLTKSSFSKIADLKVGLVEVTVERLSI